MKYFLSCFFPIQYETIWTNKKSLSLFENIIVMFLQHIKTIILTLSKIKNKNKFITCAEAVAQMGSVKKVFLKSLQNSQENTCARASF